MCYIILFFLLFFSYNNCLFAQVEDTIAYQTIEVNNLKVGIRADGLLFSNQGVGAFYHQPSGMNLLNGVGVWAGGIDPAGNIKVAVNYNHKKGYKDFAPGLLSDSGEPLNEYNFNKIWTVTRKDIERHIADYYDNGIIDDPIPAIFGWPGTGNAFFADYNDNALPDSDERLAAFRDSNHNDQYEPDLGEFPTVKVFGNFWDYPTPDIMAWFAYNDAAMVHQLSDAAPLQFEIHTTVFAYDCQESGLLNNSIFVKRNFINKGIESMDSIYIGSYQDFTLGCPDDYFGTLPDLNTIYAYDADFTPDSGCSNTSLDVIPPVVAVTNLIPMYNELENFDTYSIPLATPHPDSLWSEAVGTRFPQHPQELYNNLAHHWADNSPLSIGRDGYNIQETADTITHLFDGRLLDSITWSEAALDRPTGNRQVLFTEGPFYLNPTQRHDQQTMVYSVHPVQSTDTTTQQVIERMTTDIDSLVFAINAYFGHRPFNYLTQGGCTRDATVATKETILSNIALQLSPNPASDWFHLSVPQSTTSQGQLTIYDLYGRIVHTQKITDVRSDNEVFIGHLTTGFYVVAVQNKLQQWTGKLSVL